MDHEGIPAIDTSKAHPARLYDFYLGGKSSYPVDREAAGRILMDAPEIREVARANRAFLARAVRFLVAEEGVRRILDIGTGLPTEGNVHEVAQDADPAAGVVYVDNDPIVAAHARALLARDGTTRFVLGDLRNPKGILAAPAVRELIEPGEPVALLLIAILHFLRDDDDPVGLVGTLRDGLPPGSWVVISHVTSDIRPQAAEAVSAVYEGGATAPAVFRSHQEIAGLFADAALVDPGLVQVPLWRPGVPANRRSLERMWIYGGVGRWDGEGGRG